MKQEVIYFFIPTILITLIAYTHQTSLMFSPDVGYLLQASNQLLHGGRYVTEIFETNPPMILYLYMPAWLFAKYTGFDIVLVTRLYTLLLAAISGVVCFILLKKLIKPKSPLYLYSVYYTLLFVMFILPMFSFAQREHLLFIFMMPYLFSAALALENKPIHPVAAFFIGLFAGLGFALKPFFLVTLCLIESYFIIKKRRVFAWVRIESVVIASVLSVYFCSIFIFQPEYIKMILPLVQQYYFPAHKKAWIDIFLSHNLTFCFAISISYIFVNKSDKYPILGKVLWLALIGMMCAFLIPRQPWYYHVLPSLSLAYLLVIHFSVQALNTTAINKTLNMLWLRDISVLMLAVFLILSVPIYNYYHILQKMMKFKINHPLKQVEAYIKAHPDKNSIFCFSLGTSDCFPLIYRTGSQYAERYPFFWWYTGLRLEEKKQKSAAFSQVLVDKKYLIDGVADDLNRYQAGWIILNNEFFKEVEDKDFDLINYLSRNKKFREAWQHYQYLITLDNYRIYERKTLGIHNAYSRK